jgi:hypothetical protein
MSAIPNSRRFSPRRQVEWDGAFGLAAGCSHEAVALDDALQQVEELNPSQAKIVELRYIGAQRQARLGAGAGLAVQTDEPEGCLPVVSSCTVFYYIPVEPNS